MKFILPRTNKAGTKAAPPRWTVMVFMAAETVEGSTPLHAAAAADLKEMREVQSDPGFNLFAQLHGRGIPRRFHIGVKPNRGVEVPPVERDQADGLALRYFVNYALDTARHRGDDFSLLVLWGHAYDFAFGRSRGPDGSVEKLKISNLAKLLASLQQQARQDFAKNYPGEKVPAAPKLDILAFDACDLSTVEIACQLQPFASYLLGSEIGIPIPGWPYDKALERLRTPAPGTPMVPTDAGNWIVQRYCESYTPANRVVSLTLLDLERTRELLSFGDVLAQALLEAINRNSATRRLIGSIFVDSRTSDGRPFVDIADLCLNLMRRSGDPMVMAAAEKLGDFLISPGPQVMAGRNAGPGKPFIVAHGRNAAETARLNGLSIYAPHVAPMHDAIAVRAAYEELDFARLTKWSELVHTLAGLP
jgi:hypothetical protein